MASSGLEQRIDPQDGVVRTLAQLRARYSQQHTPEEIEEYWHNICMPVGASWEVGYPAADQQPAANDPFLTHNTEQPRDPLASSDPYPMQGQEGMMQQQQRPDPFLAGDPHGMMQGGMQPYAAAEPRSRRQQLLDAVANARRMWIEALHAVLGPGAPDRKLPARNVLVLGPWLLFIWMIVIWALLRHYAVGITILITTVFIVGSLAMTWLWYLGKRWGPVSLLALGTLCLFGVIFGTLVGQIGWEAHWRQYWWTQTGTRVMLNSASTAALARGDAAVIGFWNDKLGHTMNHTAVDDSRAAGYKDNVFYCVAPILSPDTADPTISKVNFWAVGIDCCQEFGDFTCDDSREPSGGYGVVMLDHGLPCPGCNSEKFELAVKKAEAMHKLVSAPGALYVRWVADPEVVEWGLLLRAVGFLCISCLFGFVSCFVLGSLAWYYGIGRRPTEAAPLLEFPWQKQAV